MSLKINVKNIEETQAQLALLAMPLKKRQRALWRIAKQIKIKSASNAKKQQSPDGVKWEPRKKKRKKGNKTKMLREIPKHMKITDSVQDQVEIYFDRAIQGKAQFATGTIGAMHSDGRKIKRDKAKHIKAMQAYAQRKGLDEQGKATRKQAIYLRKLGFKKPGKKKGSYVNAGTDWIMDKVSYMQAVALISELQNKPKSKGSSWTIDLPKREFLGITVQQRQQIFHRVMRDINYGWNVKKQDMRG